MRALISNGKRVFIAVALLGLSNVATAEPESPYLALQERLNQIQSLQGTFTQTIYEDNEQLQTLTGKFVIVRPAKLYWETEQPEQTVLIADGDTVWYFDPFIEQVTLFDQSEMTRSNPLLVLLEQTREPLNFQVTQQETTFHVTSEEAGAQQVLTIKFNESGALEGLTMNAGMGQTSEIVFTQYSLNQPVPSEQFTFNIPEHVIVDDQRSN